MSTQHRRKVYVRDGAGETTTAQKAIRLVWHMKTGSGRREAGCGGGNDRTKAATGEQLALEGEHVQTAQQARSVQWMATRGECHRRRERAMEGHTWRTPPDSKRDTMPDDGNIFILIE